MHNDIEKLIDLFSSFPSIGRKTSTRIVLDLISKKRTLIPNIVNNLNELNQNIKICNTCHNVDITDPCHICSSENRQKNIICLVENIEDLWAIEKGNIFKGAYHVLGGVLSAVKGITPENLNLESLQKRLENEDIDEIIIAISSSLDGQTTGYYLADILKDKVQKLTKLGYGLPLGSEIGYLDEGTINAAFESRKQT